MMWEFRGQQRPSFADVPGEGRESVWDYPRPPRVSPDARRVVVKAHGRVLADTVCAQRVLETASPPTFYVPSVDINTTLLTPTRGQSVCEWKGVARYWALRHGGDNQPVAWDYPHPLPGYEMLVDHLAFYPGRVECYVDGERVQPQPGRFYGGWITAELAGPFKGEPGSEHW